MQCFAPLENSIRDSTLVFPYEHKNHYVTNSQMATAKGHPFWKLMMKQVRPACKACLPDSWWLHQALGKRTRDFRAASALRS